MSLVVLLEKKDIIEKLLSIWRSKNSIDLDILSIFNEIIQKCPESKPFYIENNVINDLYQFLQNYNKTTDASIENAIIVINICNFFAEFFHNNSNCSLTQINYLFALIIKEIIIIYGQSHLFHYNEDKDLEKEIILKLWNSCTLSLNNFVNEPAKARLLINFNFPASIFQDLNSNDLFMSVWPNALPLILKLFRSEYEYLDELADKCVDIFVFLKIIETQLINSALIFIELININPAKYSSLLISSGIMNEIFKQIDSLSFSDFHTIILLYYKVFMNVTRNDAFTHLLNLEFYDKLVEASEVEKNPQMIEDLKKLLLIVYEMSDPKPEIQNIIDQAFEEDGILYGIPKPLMI